MARLREEFGVRWLFADTAAGKVSGPKLKAVAEVAHRSGTVTIYRLY